MKLLCDNGTAHGGDGEDFIGEVVWTTQAVATEDGLFCGRSCADSAEQDRYYRNACEDRDSWYWESNTPPWDSQYPLDLDK